MWSIFTKCLFCDQDLPNSPTGLGEHVIPANLFGFWCSHDVCSKCIEYFGFKIDKLGINNPYLINSMEKLKIQNLEKKYEQMPFIGINTLTNVPVKMIRRKGTFKATTRIEDNNFLECSETDFDYVAIPFINSLIQEKLPKDVIQKAIVDLKDKYLKLKIGESIISDIFKITLKRNQVRDVEYDFERVPIITPLIAKIVFTAIHYFVPLDLLGSLSNYWAYRDHARFNKEIKEFTINDCILQKNDIRFPFHAIRFLGGGGNTLMVDCMLFGYNNWRCLFYSDKEVRLLDGFNNEVERISFYMDFQEQQNKKKFLEFIYPDKTKQIYPFYF